MYSTLLLWIGIIEKLGGLFVWLAVLFWVIAIISAIYYFYNRFVDDSSCYFGDDKMAGAPHLARWIVFLTLAIVMTTGANILPNRTQIITFVVAQEIDKYNATQPKSALASQNTLGLVDHTAQSLEGIISNVRDMLAQKATEGVQKLVDPKADPKKP